MAPTNECSATQRVRNVTLFHGTWVPGRVFMSTMNVKPSTKSHPNGTMQKAGTEFSSAPMYSTAVNEPLFTALTNTRQLLTTTLKPNFMGIRLTVYLLILPVTQTDGDGLHKVLFFFFVLRKERLTMVRNSRRFHSL